MPYTDFHRSLVQAFLARATMTGDQASKVVAAILTAESSSAPFLSPPSSHPNSNSLQIPLSPFPKTQ
jgi:hypothetical protein